jgi:hypothetical protein
MKIDPRRVRIVMNGLRALGVCKAKQMEKHSRVLHINFPLEDDSEVADSERML